LVFYLYVAGTSIEIATADEDLACPVRDLLPPGTPGSLTDAGAISIPTRDAARATAIISHIMFHKPLTTTL